MSESCTERRAALIAALISIPAAVLIAMAVHYFVAAPQPSPPPRPAAPVMPFGGKRMAPPSGMQAEQEDVTPVYEKRVQLADMILKYGQQQVKAGKLAETDLIPLEVNCRLAEGALYRHVNKIRTRGVSLSDTAVKYDGAVRLVKNLKKRYETGKETLISVCRKTDTMLELEIQLKSNRNFNNEVWQKSYDAYRKAPNAQNYQSMIEAEREFPSFRRF